MKRSGVTSSRPSANAGPTIGHLLLADVELAQVGRSAPGAGDRAVAGIEAREHDLAAVHELRLAAVRRHAVDVDVPAVLEREDDRALVPDRLPQVGIGVAVAVERGREQAQVAARLRVDDADLRVAREVEYRPATT